jgi:quinol-cytochrome oxidoreductase complex cytochrome b subunit
MLRALVDWLDSRTGIRAARAHLLDEPIPAGTGWSFVTGSVVLFLILVQLATGVVLTMYYVPAPDHAYDSIRFIMDQLPFGASCAACTSSAPASSSSRRSCTCCAWCWLGSYKKPREVTWLTGVVLLLLILASRSAGISCRGIRRRTGRRRSPSTSRAAGRWASTWPDCCAAAAASAR